MQNEVYQMIAERGIAPQLVLDPERAVQHRVVLDGGPHVEPGAVQSLPGAEFGARDVDVVVPEESALPGGLIGQEDGGDQRSRKEPLPAREGPGRQGINTASGNQRRASAVIKGRPLPSCLVHRASSHSPAGRLGPGTVRSMVGDG